MSLVSAHQSQGSGAPGGKVTQRHKNLVNMNAALMASAQGDWVRAEEILRGLVTINPNDFVVSNSFWFYFCSPPCFFHRRPGEELTMVLFRPMVPVRGCRASGPGSRET